MKFSEKGANLEVYITFSSDWDLNIKIGLHSALSHTKSMSMLLFFTFMRPTIHIYLIYDRILPVKMHILL